MKKTIILFGLLFSVIGYSQEDNPKTTFGFKAGVNFSNLHYDFGAAETKNQDIFVISSTNAFGGFYANFPLNEKLSIQPELLASYSEDFIFAEIPLHLNYKLGKKLDLVFGPKMSYIVDEEHGNTFFSTRSAVSFDVGLKYWLTSKLSLEAIYSLGITSQKEHSISDLQRNKYYRNEFRVSLGYRF